VTVISRGLPYSTMPSAGEVARAARDNLRSSLAITHNLTLKSSEPSDSLVHRMNDVLRVVSDTNFDASSMDAVSALYTAIGEALPHMINNTHDIALVHLSRSFAVVLEEAVKMKGKLSGSSNNNNNIKTSSTSGGAPGIIAQRSGLDVSQATSPGSNNNNNMRWTPSGTWGNATQRSGIDGSHATIPGSHIINNNNNTRWTPSGAWGNTAMRSRNDVSKTSTGAYNGQIRPRSQSVGFNGYSAAARASAPLSADEIARRKEKAAKKDFSPEATKGRIKVWHVPSSVTELQLRGHFEQIGEILSISYPIENGKHKGFAFLKFKDNATADDACKRLNGGKLGGMDLLVERATFWFKKDKAPVFGTGHANVGSGSGSGPGSGKPTASVSAR
ncbi:hypothetical protein PMAYCL1PPCAC_25324, partial [Pristionchus mayeri]